MSHIAICDDQGGPLIDSIVQEITNRGHTVTEVYEDDANECVEAIFEEQSGGAGRYWMRCVPLTPSAMLR
jgi:hypothetical protein